MLDFLRNKKENLLVKIMLGAIALAFILFFGSDTLRSTTGSRASSPAEVNGVPLSAKKLGFLLNAQTENLKSTFGDKIPESYLKTVEQNMLATLINSELLRQNLEKLGVTTSGKELKDFIKNNPEFQQDGKFNTTFYLNKFLPWYKLTRGTSYEKDMQDILSAEKILNEFETVLEFTQEELKQEFLRTHTKYKFSVIKISTTPEEKLPKELQDTSPKEGTAESLVKQKGLVEKIYTKWKNGEDLKILLEENHLEKKLTEELSLPDLKRVFDGNDDVSLLKALASLKPESPFPKEFFTIGNFYYLVKLEDRNILNKVPSDEELQELKTSLSEEITRALESSWIQNLKQNSDITRL